jgi:benzoyl-CoA reductase/2-hydroxyglutaryl-CoA dehydratase subunit BcrC/BadD/HgdB
MLINLISNEENEYVIEICKIRKNQPPPLSGQENMGGEKGWI